MTWIALLLAALLSTTRLQPAIDAVDTVQLAVLIRTSDSQGVPLDPTRDSLLLISETTGVVARYPLTDDFVELSLTQAEFDRTEIIMVELEGYFLGGVRTFPRRRRYLVVVEPMVIE